jgi:putative ABC transport system permease protein
MSRTRDPMSKTGIGTACRCVTTPLRPRTPPWHTNCFGEKKSRRGGSALKTHHPRRLGHPLSRLGRLLEELRRDLAYAVRALASNPSFTSAAVLTLALGIGATVAVFSIVRGVLLQPLPFANPDRIVRIVENVPAEESFSGRAMRLPSMNQEEFEWWRAEASSFSEMAITMPETRTATFDGTLRLSGARVSPALFHIRGIQPLVGRWLVAEEERPGSLVTLISEDTWRRHYASDPDITSRHLVLDGVSYAIVGVMPRVFGNEAFWTPFTLEPPRDGAVMFVAALAQLREGVRLEEAVVEVNALGARLRGLEAADGARFEIVREQDQIVATVRPALQLLASTVGLVLLIVCANMANLTLARGMKRLREIAIRRALGAGRARIVRQLLTESIALSVAGGAVGMALAYAAVAFVGATAVIEIPWRFRFAIGFLGETILPRVDEVALDSTALVFAFGVSVLTGLVFGLLPAMRLSRSGGDIPSGRLGGRADGPGTRTGQLLAGVQLSLATALLVGAGLLVHSFVNLTSLELGFDLNTQIFQLVSPNELPQSRKLALALEVEQRIASSGRVEAVGFTNTAQPLEANDDQGTIVPLAAQVDRANPGDENRSESRTVTPGYLRALGVRLVEGRWLDPRDSAGEPRAILVSNAWVRRFSPDRSPVGTTVYSLCRVLGRCTDTPSEIVGVVEDVRLRMDGGSGAPVGGLPRSEMPKAVFSDLLRSMPPADVLDRSRDAQMGGRGSAGDASGLSFAVRVRGAPLTSADLRSIVTEVDARLAVDGFTTMGEVVSAITARPRFYATTLTVFAAVAALVAAVGVYGVLSYAVSQRMHEFGVRLALGAAPPKVLALALRQGLIVVLVGIPVGIVAATELSRYLGGMLFGITPLDAPTYVGVAVAFAAVALAACYLPARRAANVDPVAMLRAE